MNKDKIIFDLKVIYHYIPSIALRQQFDSSWIRPKHLSNKKVEEISKDVMARIRRIFKEMGVEDYE